MKHIKGVIEYRLNESGKNVNYCHRYKSIFSFIAGMVKAHLKGADVIINHKNK